MIRTCLQCGLWHTEPIPFCSGHCMRMWCETSPKAIRARRLAQLERYLGIAFLRRQLVRIAALFVLLLLACGPDPVIAVPIGNLPLDKISDPTLAGDAEKAAFYAAFFEPEQPTQQQLDERDAGWAAYSQAVGGPR